MKFDTSNITPKMSEDLAGSLKRATPVVVLCLSQAIVMFLAFVAITDNISDQIYKCCDIVADNLPIFENIRKILVSATKFQELRYLYALFVIFALIQLFVFSIILVFSVLQFRARHYFPDSWKESVIYWTIVFLVIASYAGLFFGFESYAVLRESLKRDDYSFIYTYLWALPGSNFALYIIYFARFSDFGGKINK